MTSCCCFFSKRSKYCTLNPQNGCRQVNLNVAGNKRKNKGCTWTSRKEPTQGGNRFKWKKGEEEKRLFILIKCGECARYPHARLGPCDHHHAEGDALVQVPLLNGRRQANDPHKQESGVFAILCRHLDKKAYSATKYPNRFS